MHEEYRTYRDEEATEDPHGHVTSISVLRNYRRLGLANKLMQLSRASIRILSHVITSLTLGENCFHAQNNQ